MPRMITPYELHRQIAAFAVVDVRKTPALVHSGRTIPGAMRRRPFDAESWWAELQGRRAAVFCVHGQEVSQAVCGFLSDNGVDAVFLEGGFEAWKEGGFPTAPSGERP